MLRSQATRACGEGRGREEWARKKSNQVIKKMKEASKEGRERGEDAGFEKRKGENGFHPRLLAQQLSRDLPDVISELG
jgi:hypothetical protein